jgi:hypothetical protein
MVLSYMLRGDLPRLEMSWGADLIDVFICQGVPRLTCAQCYWTCCGATCRASLQTLCGTPAGHNADDIAETVLLNMLRGDLPRLGRCAAIFTGEQGALPRVKPFKCAGAPADTSHTQESGDDPHWSPGGAAFLGFDPKRPLSREAQAWAARAARAPSRRCACQTAAQAHV